MRDLIYLGIDRSNLARFRIALGTNTSIYHVNETYVPGMTWDLQVCTFANMSMTSGCSFSRTSSLFANDRRLLTRYWTSPSRISMRSRLSAKSLLDRYFSGIGFGSVKGRTFCFSLVYGHHMYRPPHLLYIWHNGLHRSILSALRDNDHTRGMSGSLRREASCWEKTAPLMSL